MNFKEQLYGTPYNLLTYMGVFDLVQTRGACSDGFFDHSSLCSPITTSKGEGFYVELFFISASPME